MDNLTQYVDSIFRSNNPKMESRNAVLKFFYNQLYRDYNPDINGYTLVFMVPPDLSGYRSNCDVGSKYIYGFEKGSYMMEVGKFITFAATDFTPPQRTMNVEQAKSRSGGASYATEVDIAGQCSITFIDNIDLDIYMFHHTWFEYIRESIEGLVKPAKEYLDPPDPDKNPLYGAIDYAASIYVVKYKPDMKTITFVGKITGVFPQGLPTKELIGQRTSNELTTLPFNYVCSYYQEAIWQENIGREKNHWLFEELEHILEIFVRD